MHRRAWIEQIGNAYARVPVHVADDAFWNAQLQLPMLAIGVAFGVVNAALLGSAAAVCNSIKRCGTHGWSGTI